MEKQLVGKKWALIDLHLHLDGSLSLETVKALAAMEGIGLPEEDRAILEMVQCAPDCRDLNEYLEKFDFPCSLLQTEEAIRFAVCQLAEELKEQGLLYAEIRFAPQKHTDRGLAQARVVEAAIDGLKNTGFRAGLILCCMRGGDNRAQNLETVRVAKAYLGKGVCAVDLAGAEALFPTAGFEDVFALARELEVPFTIHAGEADGPESIRTALAFGARRLGHGVRAAEDEALMERLAREGVTLELCPTSNLNTCVFESVEDYPIRELLEAGIPVTVNTDNMTVSGVTLASEFRKVADACCLTEEQLRTLAKNAVEAAFADKETKTRLREEIGRR